MGIQKEYVRVPVSVFYDILGDSDKVRKYVVDFLEKRGLKPQSCIDELCFSNYSIDVRSRSIIVRYNGEDKNGNPVNMKFYFIPALTNELKRLRRKYRDEMLKFLKENGFECRFRGKWVCEHENNYTVTIDNEGIRLVWEYENSRPGVRYANGSVEHDPIVWEITSNAAMEGGIVFMRYERSVLWDLLLVSEEEFRYNLEELKKFISEIKNYRIWFSVDIVFDAEYTG